MHFAGRIKSFGAMLIWLPGYTFLLLTSTRKDYAELYANNTIFNKLVEIIGVLGGS